MAAPANFGTERITTADKILYTAKAHTTGGRDGGASHSSDGRLQRRAETLQTFGNLTSAECEKGGIHPTRGRITIAGVVSIMARHDDNHVDQLAPARAGRASRRAALASRSVTGARSRPPATDIVSPVMEVAYGEARDGTAFAISTGGPSRQSGVMRLGLSATVEMDAPEPLPGRRVKDAQNVGFAP